MSRQKNFIRNSLTLDITPFQEADQENKLSGRNQVSVKPLQSMRSVLGKDKNGFKSDKKKKNIPRQLSFTINQLQQQKLKLMDSLSILKNSAVSALAQKEDQIEQLRQEGLNFQENYDELYDDYKSQKGVSEHCRVDYEKFMEERNLLVEQLRQKEEIIEELLVIIQNFKSQMGELQHQEQQHLIAIKQLEERIQTLNNQIQDMTLKLAVDEISVEELPNKMQSTNSQGELGLTSFNILQPFEDQNHYHHLIQELHQDHRKELCQLSQFYQQKIKTLREHYDTYLRDQFQQNIKEFDIQLPQTYMLEGQKSLNRSQSQSQYKKYLVPASEMLSLDRVSSHSIARSTHNLQEEIASPTQFKDIENYSQFTKNHFDNPFIFCKHKSTVNFDRHAKTQVINIEDRSTKQTLEKDISIQMDSPQPSPKEVMWQKAKLFTSGLISGVTLTSIVSFAMRKKK